jgi:hypothetical protein
MLDVLAEENSNGSRDLRCIPSYSISAAREVRTMSTTTTQTAGPDPGALPPPLALYYLGIGHYFSRATYVVAKLGIADLLADGPRETAELAAASR